MASADTPVWSRELLYEVDSADFPSCHAASIVELEDGTLLSVSEGFARADFQGQHLDGALRSNAEGLKPGAPVKGAVRAEQIRIGATHASIGDADSVFEGKITDVIFEGERLLYEIAVPSIGADSIRIFHHDQNEFATHDLGQTVFIGWNSRDLHVFVAGSKDSIFIE
jgi:putative spermidine/putrescine transport system ATP-binding protein